MDSGVFCRPLGRQLKAAVASHRAAQAKHCSLVARATAVRHGLFSPLGGHVLAGEGHSLPERHLHQHPHTEADRNSLASSVQLPQGQPSSSSPDPSAYDLALHSPARKPTAWTSDSHTRPANSRLAAYGCYRLVGPARISKRGDTLVAHMFRGSRIELLDRDGNATPYGSTEEQDFVGFSSTASSSPSYMASASSSEDGDAAGDYGGGDTDSCVAECVLVAAHVELCGSACSVDLVDLRVQPAVHHHNGHTYVSVRSLPPEAIIQLDADADLRHPINITPTPPPEAD